MGRDQSICGLLDKVKCPGQGQRFVLDDFAQRAPLNIFGSEKASMLVFADLVDRDDVRMIEG